MAPPHPLDLPRGEGLPPVLAPRRALRRLARRHGQHGRHEPEEQRLVRQKQLLPLLRAGYIVRADRYKYTAMARDGSRDVPSEVIEATYAFAREPDLTLYFDVPVDVSFDRIAKGRPKLKYYEAGMDMGWTTDRLDSYKIFQGKVSDIYSGLVEQGRMVGLDAQGTVAEVQSRVREAFQQHIDLSKVQTIDQSDRLAQNLSESDIDWLTYAGGEEGK